jgi:hypothetical protein
MDAGFILQSPQKACAHQRVGAIDPDEAEVLRAVLRLADHIFNSGPRAEAARPLRSALPLLGPPSSGPSDIFRPLLCARSDELDILAPVSILPKTLWSSPQICDHRTNTFVSLCLLPSAACSVACRRTTAFAPSRLVLLRFGADLTRHYAALALLDERSLPGDAGEALRRLSSAESSKRRFRESLVNRLPLPH